MSLIEVGRGRCLLWGWKEEEEEGVSGDTGRRSSVLQAPLFRTDSAFFIEGKKSPHDKDEAK